MDKKYWELFYLKHGKDKDISECSSFAQFCLDNFFIGKNFNIIELGSGNGRDAIYLASHEHSVVAIDQSTTAIDIEKQGLNIEVAHLLSPRAADFVYEDYTQYKKIDAFYSRFTIHSITKSDEEALLSNVYSALKDGGLFCIEVRTTKDPLCGVGQDCGDNTFMTDGHRRRFIDSVEFRNRVVGMGFKELYFIEKDNLSVYKNDNPVLMRIILKK
jgi:tellurite methyltransferase